MTIVVGVDHTTGSGQALDLAVREAELRGADLRIVHVGEPAADPPEAPATSRRASPGVQSTPDSRPHDPTGPEAVIEGALARARRTLPPNRTTAEVLPGRAARVLVEQVTALDLLVVGSRNLGSARSVLLGSVGSAVTAHAPCPVIVARHTAGSTTTEITRVLAGSDRSYHAHRTLEFAFLEAQLRGVPLDVISCWRQHGFLTPHEQRQVSEQLRDKLEIDINALTRRHPGVRAAGDVFEGQASDILPARADAATLLVIGARGAGGVLGGLLGSVSRGVLHHARCPVAVIRPTS